MLCLVMALNKMRKIIFITLLLLSVIASAAPIILTVGPAIDGDCQFNTIQEAIDSANFNMDIRISNQLVTNTGVSIIDKDIAFVRGGYASCQDALNDVVDIINPYSTVSNNNGDGISIDYSVMMNNTIFFEGLKVNQSQIGVNILANGANQNLTMNFSNVVISNNSANGLKVKGATVVVNFDKGEINHNSGAIFGGGVQCFLSELNFGEQVAIHHNSANSGGGMSLNNCTMVFSAGDTHPLNSLQYGIFSNTANLVGAGLNIDKSTVQLLGTSLHPVSIVNNEIIAGSGSINKGGGIIINGDSTAIMVNIRLDNNISHTLGGAIYASFNSATAVNPTLMQIARHPDGCVYSEVCNSISSNSINGFTGQGGAIYLTGGVNLIIAQTVIKGNTTTTNSNIIKVKGGSQLGVLSSLLINNSDATDLVNQEDGSGVFVQLSTFADNQVDNYFNVLYDNNTAQLLEVKDTIIMNGIATIANLNNDMGNHDAQVKCSLVENNDASGVVQNQSQIGVATFFSVTDYRLQHNSLGLNSVCTTIGEFDLARYDILSSDRFISANPDLGAYEMGYLFNDGFE